MLFLLSKQNTKMILFYETYTQPAGQRLKYYNMLWARVMFLWYKNFYVGNNFNCK